MKSKIKIMHLFPSNKYSGAENVVLTITDMFRNDEDISMSIVCGNGPIKKQLEEHGVNYQLLDSFNYKNIRRIVNMEKPDIIHAHDFTATMMATRFKIPVIAHLHNNPLWQKRINMKSIGYATCIHKLTKVYGVSESVYEEYIFRKLYRNKFEVLPNVVDKEKIIKMSEKSVDDIRNIDIIVVGRLTAPKNPLKALSVINTINKHQKVNALFLGDGELKKECEEYIEQNDLYNTVCLKGNVENPYKYMKKAKVLLMPSLWEGFGLAAVEALVLGVPVVCSGVGGLKDIIDNSNGQICNNEQEYVDEIRKLLNDKKYLSKKKQKAIESSCAFCEMDEYYRCLKKTYEKEKKRE